jgi:hypothetical protein
LLIRGGGRIIIDCRRRIYWNRSIVEENTARGDPVNSLPLNREPTTMAQSIPLTSGPRRTS